MVPTSKGDPREARGSEASEEGAVVRHDDRGQVGGQGKEGVVRGAVGFDALIPAGETERRLRMPVVGRQESQLFEDRDRDDGPYVAEETPELRVQVHAELKRHEQGVGIEEDRARQRFRAFTSHYLTLKVRIGPSVSRGGEYIASLCK